MFQPRFVSAALFLFSSVLIANGERPKESPGFWERAWHSGKRASSATADRVAHPFGSSSNSKKADTKEEAWNQLQMSLTVEPSVIKIPATRSFRVAIAVVNSGKKFVQLNFPSSQRIEVIVRGEGGKVISRWSDDQKVEDDAALVSINPAERLEYSAAISTRDMVPGRTYQVEAFFPSFDALKMTKVVTVEK